MKSFLQYVVSSIRKNPDQRAAAPPLGTRKAGLLRTAMLAGVFMLISIGSAFASHFRYGNVNWTRISETSTHVTIRLDVNLSWRLGAADPGAYFYLQQSPYSSYYVPFTNVPDPSGNWTNSTGSTTITLPKSTSVYTLTYNGCCKISTLANNRDTSWNIFTTINTSQPGSSPVSTLPAIINMPINAPAATYTIPASDPDPGSTLSYRLATSAEMGGGNQPAGISINATTGQITFNTVNKAVGQLYNSAVVVTDNNGNSIILDFIINMTNSSTPPAFNYTATPVNGTVFNVMAGQNISFAIRAEDSDPNSNVSLSAAGLPAYITTSNFSPAFPATGNPSQTTFSWTPASAQIGNTVVLNFIATDNVGVQSSTSVTIRVVAEPAPQFISHTPGELTIRNIPTGVLHQDQIVAQSSLGSNVSIAFATGIPAGATLSPAIPTTGANPGQTTLSWTPTPADFGQKTLSFQAIISSTPTIFATRTYSLIVNTKSAFSSTPALTAKVGQPYTYTITINDPDIAYGDIIDITAANLPTWLTLTKNGNGTATLSGTPTMANVGNNHIHLHAEDTYHLHGPNDHVGQEFVIEVAQPCNTVLAANAINVSCFGAANGSIDLNVSGGTAPFTFAWSNGATTEDITNLGPGTYNVTVTDANNCTATTSATITQPADRTPVANADQLTAQACQSFTFTAAQLLGNDTDPQGGTLQIADVLQPSNGTITDNRNGTYTYTPTQGFSGNVTFTYVAKKNDPIVAYSGNNHYYEYVSAPGICWTDAKNAAESRFYYGMRGYLATITTSGENAFAAAKLQGNGWIGGSDAAVEGQWRWATGPEAGQQFWNGLYYGFATGYHNWAGGEPNNAGNEDYAHFYTGSGQWNDLPNCPGSGWISGYVVEYGGMEACNPQLTATATVTINVTAPAPITVNTRNLSVNLNAAGTASITAAQINNGSSSSCGIASVSVSPTNFTCANKGANTVTLTVIDNYGQTATGTATVTVSDIINPTISAPAAVNVFANTGTCNATNVNLGTASAADNCAGVVTSNNAPASFPVGTTTVTWTATDASGNTATATQLVTVTDNQAPTIAGPHNQIIDLNNACSVALPDFRNQLLALGDNCTPNNALVVTQTPAPGTVVTGTGNMTVSFTARDAAGNIGSASFTVTKRDNIAPVVATKNHTVYLNANGVATVTTADVNNNSSDNCSPVALTFSNSGTVCGIANEGGVLTLTAPAGAVFTSINFASYGNAGGSCGSFAQGWCHAANSNAVVANALIGKNSGSIAANNGVFGDPCFGTFKRLVVQATYSIQGISANGNEITFNCSQRGNNTVTLIGTDASGNVSSQTAVVTVVDNIDPVVVTKNITVQLDAAGNATITANSVDNGSADNCGIASLTVSKTTFDCSNIGDNTVTLTATDASGNVTTGTATITVEDKVAPVVITKNVIVQLDANGNGSIVAADVNNGSSDACGIASISVNKTSFTCANVGDNTVTLTVTDVNGNTATGTATVVVQDNVAPVAIAQNLTIQLDAAGSATITAADVNNGSADACGIASLALNQTSFDCSNVGDNTVTLTVTDNHGNQATATATVTVEDNVKPIAITQNISVTLVNGTASITAADVNNGSSDACGIASLALDKTTFSCEELGKNTVTLTVTDVNGNVSTATAMVNVIGVKPTPAITVSRSGSNINTGASQYTIFMGYGNQAVMLTAANTTSAPAATRYSWSPATGLSNANAANPIFTPTAGGSYTFNVTATNEFGCTATASVTIKVIDARCGSGNSGKLDKVLVCHNGKEICIAPSAVPAHLAHGCSIGACGSVTARNAAAEPTAVLEAYPNPFSDKATLSFTTLQDSKFRLEVLDIKGSLVKVMEEGSAKAGKQYGFELTAGNLSEGIYIVRLITDTEVKTIKMVLKK